MNFLDKIKDKKIVVCCGSGGVGKTTVSAAVALGAAAEGRKVLVLTIDPARRLAQAMGLEAIDVDMQKVPDELFVADGMEFKGELHVMMLDAKRVWDEIVVKNAPDEEVKKRILKNRLYNYLSDHLAGSQEFMAMEKLYDLHRAGEFDLIVLDTPPTKHALDFLEAPNKLASFIEDGRFIRVFVKPGFKAGKVAFDLFKAGTTAALKVVQILIGSDIMVEVSEFVSSFESYYDGFHDRAKKVSDLLKEDGTLFLLVAGPTRMVLSETRYFYDVLKENGMPFGGFLINRCHDNFVDSPEKLKEIMDLVNDEDRLLKLGDEIGKDPELGEKYRKLATNIVTNFRRLQDLRRMEEKNIGQLLKLTQAGDVLIQVPLFDRDIHDVGGLHMMNRHIFGGE